MAIRLGNSGPDFLDGTSFADFIRGFGDSDTLQGQAGNDLMLGDDGDDYIYDSNESGSFDLGNDTMVGGSGDDEIYSFGGKDLIDAGEGDEECGDYVYIDRSELQKGLQVYGTGIPSESDSPFVNLLGSSMVMSDGSIATNMEQLELIATAQSDTIMLANVFGLEKTWVYAGEGGDVVTTGSSKDKVWADDGNDTVVLGAGDDKAWGGEGNDSMWGAADNDKLWGNDGNDKLFGGNGDDTIDGGDGRDRYVGGNGADTFVLEQGEIDYDLISDYQFDNPAELQTLEPASYDTIKLEGYFNIDPVLSLVNESTGLVQITYEQGTEGQYEEYFFAPGITSEDLTYVEICNYDVPV
ncbi:calcium-binding protein [Acuticoccus sp. I52.16.1]|uniref:calcium-binding protein n=1 Tax=Acuticoccus sp. I52.16.1 TaxID=2928472 RepID=UPI001FD00609|nr:hypothetical protein [Acuticoccus sp. I52.16.1]UOM35088.1 hypothetical protein MRB58_02425 [Acuticoccus sp. I52.16.1]